LLGGVLVGAGGFNLFDGTIQHKLLRLHPVREGVENIWVYDVTFIGVALVMAIAGWALIREP